MIFSAESFHFYALCSCALLSFARILQLAEDRQISPRTPFATGFLAIAGITLLSLGFDFLNGQVSLPTQVLWFLLVSHFLYSWGQMKGPIHGGSDSMTGLGFLCLSPFIIRAPENVSKYFIFYYGAQTGFSYFVSGLVKMKNLSWRSGEALRNLGQLQKYPLPKWTQSLFQRTSIAFGIAWSILLFELSVPLVVLLPNLIMPFLTLALLFHFSNVALLGLNRFVWAWLAAYPAFIYTVIALAGSG